MFWLAIKIAKKGNYLTPTDKNKQSERESALELMGILDAYNNDAFAVCVF